MYKSQLSLYLIVQSQASPPTPPDQQREKWGSLKALGLDSTSLRTWEEMSPFLFQILHESPGTLTRAEHCAQGRKNRQISELCAPSLAQLRSIEPPSAG